MKKIFSEGHGDRVTGLFGKDEILGSYLSKTLPILLAFYFFINKKKTNENFILLLLILFFYQFLYQVKEQHLYKC